MKVLIFVILITIALCIDAHRINIRGDESLDLNCPSISFKFPSPSTLRCESCKAVARLLHYNVVERFLKPEEVIISDESGNPPICQDVGKFMLRQKTNGFRFWDLSRLMTESVKNSDYVDDDYDPLPAPAELNEEHNPSREKGSLSYNNRPVTYHSRLERETLPCATYFLQKYCVEDFLAEKTEEHLDHCIYQFQKSKKDVYASSRFLTCLTETYCTTRRDCIAEGPHIVTERESFLKYEKTFGNKKFPFVGTVDNARKLERNPLISGL